MIKHLYNKHKGTAGDFFWRALQLMGKEGVTFFIFAVAAKFLSPIEFGTYNYIMAMVFFLIMFSDFGISAATSKFVAEFYVTDKDSLRSILFNTSIAITLLSLGVALIAFSFGAPYLGSDYNYLIYLLPLVFLSPMTSLYDGIYRGLRRFKRLALITITVGLSSVPVIVLLVKDMGLLGALIAQVLFYVILLSALAVSYREWGFKFNRSVLVKIGKYSFILGITTLGYFLFTRINVLILGHFNFIEQIGYYEIINKIFTILLIPFSILAQVIAPQITQLVAQDQKEDVITKYKEYIAISGIAGTVIALSTYIALPLVIKVFLNGYNVQEITQMLWVLLPILVTQSMSAIAATGFSTASGHAHMNMYFLLFFGLVNIVLTTSFILIFGFWGVIYSTLLVKATADFTFLIWYFIYIKRQNYAFART